MNIVKLIRIVLLSAAIVSCSSKNPTPSEVYQNQNAAQISRTAEVLLAKRNYKDAVQAFEALDSLYPFGAHTEQAQLDVIYAHYQADEMPSAVAAADRFLRLYPRSPHADYAYYIKGLANFEQDESFLHRYIATDPSKRDATTLKRAFLAFTDLIRLYPQSPYAPDAHQRLIYLRNTFADQELIVAKFYMEKKAYVAAVNRATYVLKHYQSTPMAREALQILVQANRAMGLNQSAAEAQRVLDLNYPARSKN